MATLLAEKSATLEGLLREEGKAELIGGKQAAFAIAVSLRAFILANRLPGLAVPDNAGFACELPNRKSFSPDAAYDTGPRDFAAETRSEGDYGPTAEDERESILSPVDRIHPSPSSPTLRLPMPTPPYPAGSCRWPSFLCEKGGEVNFGSLPGVSCATRRHVSESTRCPGTSDSSQARS
jgi:hypothetical protein